MRSIRTVAAIATVAALGLLLAACGSSSSSSSSSSGSSSSSSGSISTSGYQSPETQSLTGGKKGGVLQVLDETDFEHIDPGIAYYSLDYEVVFATQRPLYSNKPNTASEATPDMAAGPPEVSSDNKTVTVHLREGIKFSPPVNREVTSEDVAYAIERGANPNVANPYIHAYFESVEGMPKADGGPIKGITTPDKHTIVFKLTEPKGGLVAASLVLPLTAAVPKEYAEKYDKHKPSDYGNYQVATGPYMFKNDSSGKVLDVGYFPGKSATLVRNPNWNASTDIRPAYLNEIQIKIGGTNSVIGKQVLEGTNIVENEPPAQSNIRLAAEKYKGQLEISPGAGSHYIGVDNAHGPFKNENLRKAFFAALDRTAMDKARGGKLVTDVMTHFIYPTIPGFEQSGGLAGPKFDFNEHPEGDKAVAEKYIKLAGYPSGKYTGGETITIVGAKGNPAEQDAEIVNQTLKNLGFTTKFTLVETATMYAKYCNVPKEEIDVCPSVGWIADFGDPQTVLNITFNGKFINATGNVNWSQANNPQLNKEMTEAESVTGQSARATAWAKIDEHVVEKALTIPFDWDKQGNIEGSQVQGVGDLWDVGEWDYSWTSLK
ncbi:MAG TPA: ABC transporter substrate-binding protein [Solirubrobacteraceae bacterium]|nr:ABC transporter substrate-binding protein [Solirubrobacteraceae bacterium]